LLTPIISAAAPSTTFLHFGERSNPKGTGICKAAVALKFTLLLSDRTPSDRREIIASLLITMANGWRHSQLSMSWDGILHRPPVDQFPTRSI
jgi:hypothetical protein